MNKSKIIIITLFCITLGLTTFKLISPRKADQDISVAKTATLLTNSDGYFIYRGIITEKDENFITVEQVNGFNYGIPKITFLINKETAFSVNAVELELGHFIEVQYKNNPYVSKPNEITASEIILISTFGEDILKNGNIISSTPIDADNFRVEIETIVDGQSSSTTIILLVPVESMEILSPEDLTEGLLISAITKGVATASIPPQYPVLYLLPIE
ncbi:hypothetical protein [Anaerosphaera multitolerans]|uniref:Uncharacterized protein n=1 Tax=Anaerosphaera multitolerans TaxID=2487351 RepID=A0A437S5V4_9FIRM|nr:hypothetical protein [Anaerosphaera multitolerans]RVU54413.1 hypothetical protein EF514_07405 [Anaerosphaera multitolerans]